MPQGRFFYYLPEAAWCGSSRYVLAYLKRQLQLGYQNSVRVSNLKTSVKGCLILVYPFCIVACSPNHWRTHGKKRKLQSHPHPSVAPGRGIASYRLAQFNVVRLYGKGPLSQAGQARRAICCLAGRSCSCLDSKPPGCRAKDGGGSGMKQKKEPRHGWATACGAKARKAVGNYSPVAA